jgi:ribosomal protein S18 acetylase RimI-like enzyme
VTHIPVKRWVVDRASVADLDALAELMTAAPLVRRYGTTHAAARSSLESAIGAGDLLLTCRPSAKAPPIGLAWVIRTRILNQGAYLRLLLVDEEHRGHGVGRRLLRVAEERAREACNHLYFLVTSDNVRARRFYERHGYRKVGELPELVHPGIDEALYHKALRGHDERGR